MRAKWWAIATAATLAVVLAGVAAWSSDLYVGGGGTPNYVTIQAAVTAAGSGDTIHVAAGTYAEQVTITKALTLQGAGATTIIKPTSLTTYVTTPSVAESTVCTGAVVVNNAGGAVVVKNLKVDASSLNTDRTLWFTPSVALMKFAGVFYYNTSGTIDNVVSTNTNHITIATTGASTWGRQVQSFKIDADATTTVSVELKNCTASTFLGEAISVGWNTPTATQTVNIHNNTITGDGSVANRRQNGIDVYYGFTVTAISHNTISNLVYRKGGMNWATGITAADVQPGAMIEYNEISNCDFGITDTYSSGITIQHNTITGSGHTYGTGVYIDNGPASITGIVVHANTIGSGFPAGGICLRGWYAGTNTISESITDNVLTGNGTTDGYGIYDWSGAAGAITSTITGNTITGWDTGIFIDAGAPVTGFTISKNKISGNGSYGVNNGAVGTLVATNNWWGSASGPGPVGTGTGDRVSARVTYNPWYVDAAMTTLSNVAPANVYVSSTYVDGNAGGHAFGYDAFTTIQAGINAVATGGTVNVAAGLYKESNILVNKSLTIQGVGATRDAVVVAPAAADVNADNAFTNAQNGFVIAAHGVTIRNLTINGRGNAALPDYSTKYNYRIGIVTLDASQTGGGAWNNLLVDNVVVQYTYRRGISVFPRSVYGTTIQNSTVEYVAFNHGMYLGGQSEVLDNTIKHCFQGIVQDPDATTTNTDLVKANGNTLTEIGNFPGCWSYPNGQPRAIQCNPTGPARAFEVKDNIISDNGLELYAGVVGVYTRLWTSDSVLSGNDITLTSGVSWADVGSQAVGMLLGWIYDEGFTVASNHVHSNKYGIGMMVFGSGSAAKPMLLEGNTITSTSSAALDTGDGSGIYVANQYLFSAGDKSPSYLVVGDGNTISGFVKGINAELIPTSTQALTVIAHRNTITGNTTGIDASTMTTPVDATANWWGAASGPGTVGPGSGDQVTANVTYDPWYVDAGMTILSNSTGASAKAITAFSFNALSPAVVGTVTESTHSVALTVPFGTNVTALVPTITHTGASISPNSGVPNNFTTPQTYTVTAVNGSTQAYAVTVTLGVASAVTYVDAARPNDSGDGLTPATAKKTIQSGINIVAADGTVHVAAGTYSESVTITKSLTLRGSSDPSPTIDGGGAGTAVTISASNVTVTGFTIQNASTGIAATSGTGNTVHLCNIISNSAWGINNTSGSMFDATDNSWGVDSGPSGGAADPVTGRVANGTGSKVSANVRFDPWTGMSTSVVTEPDVGQGGVVTNPDAGASLTIDTASGTTDVTIAEYTSPPPDTPSFGAGATYLDIMLSDPAAVTQLTITFTDMSPGTVIYFYRPGTGWVRCSIQAQVGSTITVTVTASTTPTLAELTGTIFAGGTGIPVTPYAIGDVNGNGEIDVLDARLCLQIATGFLAGTPEQREAADVDNDGNVDLADAETLAQYIIGIITELPGAE